MMPASAADIRRSVEQEYRYERLTWPEINEAVALKKVAVLPVGSTEQHGHHLPLDVDAKLSSAVVYEGARRAPADMLVLPPVAYGYCHHVMDFPGTINIEPGTFVRFLLDITRSVAYHGFKRIVVVNGHGSNHPLVEEVGRQTILQTDALCLTLSWWQLVAQRWNREWRESAAPGGCAHACELETSMYQHVDPDGVRGGQIRSEAAAFMALPGALRWHTVDLTGASSPAAIVEWTSTYTESGVIGEAARATPGKGRDVFEHAVTQFVEMVRWFRTRPRPERRDHHATPPTFALPFGW